MKNIINLLIAFAAAVLLQGCASSGPVGTSPSVQMADLAELPPPSGEDYLLGDAVEAIRPLDTINVEVFAAPDLSRAVQVGANGAIEYPLIGTVQVNGLTPSQVSTVLEQRLQGRYLVDPDVAVTIQSRTGQVFTIGGQVRAPGRYPLALPTTLAEAVAVSGGVAEFANQDEVLVFRTIAGERYIGIYNLKAIQRGNYPDPDIYPRDLIVVGDSPNRRLLSTLVSFSPLLTTPIILLERLLPSGSGN